jgi:hypothetical protein
MRIGMAILLILGAVIVGAIGYQIGVSQAITVATPGATTVPAVYPYFWHPFGFFGFGFLGLLFPLLFLFLIFGLVRAAWWGRGGYGGGRWYGGDRRAMLEQWHREMHGEKPAGTTEQQREEGPRR